jgi:hypothetical protein
MRSLALELRLAFRSLVAQLALTAAIVFTIGLAVAANTALFSVFDGLLFRPLPYRDADRIVHLGIDQALRLAGGRAEAVARVNTTFVTGHGAARRVARATSSGFTSDRFRPRRPGAGRAAVGRQHATPHAWLPW